MKVKQIKVKSSGQPTPEEDLSLKELSGFRAPETKYSEAVVGSVIAGLRHRKQSTQMHSFAALTTLIHMDSNLKTTELIMLMDSILQTDLNNSKGEKRRIYVAKILGYGALIRAGRISVSQPQLFSPVFSQLITQAKKRVSLLIVATSFICELLEQQVLPAHSIEELNSLFNHYESMNSSLLLIALTALQLQPTFECPSLENMEDLCSMLTTNAMPEEPEYFEILLTHLKDSDRMQMFWETLIPKLNQSHLELLCLLVHKSVEKEVSPNLFVCRQVIVLLLSVFRKQNKDAHLNAASAFHQIFLYITMSVNQTGRLDSIKLLFTGTPNVLHEYKFLHSSLRVFLSFLSPEELGLLTDICTPSLQEGHRGRSTVSTINFLTRIAQLKISESMQKFNILNSLFLLGFCTKPTSGTDTNFETTTKKSREAFRAIVKSTYEKSVVDHIHQTISSIVTNQNSTDTALAVPLAAEVLDEWKKLNRLSTSAGDTHMSTCLKINALLLLLDPSAAPHFIEKLLAFHYETKKKPMTAKTAGLVSFVLDTANDDRSILNNEALISRLLKEELIQEDSIQLIVDAIEADNASDESHNDEDSSSDDESAVSNNDIPKTFTPDAEDIAAFLKTVSNRNVSESSDGESSIDMDDASDSELNQLDATLSQIITRQSVKKEERQGGVKNLLRVLRLVELVFKRYKIPNANILLMLLMPCLTCLIKCSKTKRRSNALPRILAVVKRISCIKKVTGTEDIDIEIVNSLLEDVHKILKKKLSKNVRQLVQGVVGMLSKCFQAAIATKPASVETNGTGNRQQGKKRKANSLKIVKTKVAKCV